ncbi:hypothetical protein H8E88_13445 [candidate division KSB1 bacterium]|nr:hypothetical protein [candidate division KSB1 bacterium]
MGINIASPSKLLKPYIKQYWSIENVVPNGEQYVQRIIPSGLSELLIYLSPRPKITDNTKSLSENLILSGHQKEYYDILIEGNLLVFSVVFQPQGLMQFFNFPLTEIYNQNVPLKYLNKKLGQDLEQKMLEANSFQKRVQLIEVFLMDLLKENKNRIEFKRINYVVKLIKKTQGDVNINFLASEAV